MFKRLRRSESLKNVVGLNGALHKAPSLQLFREGNAYQRFNSEEDFPPVQPAEEDKSEGQLERTATAKKTAEKKDATAMAWASLERSLAEQGYIDRRGSVASCESTATEMTRLSVISPVMDQEQKRTGGEREEAARLDFPVFKWETPGGGPKQSGDTYFTSVSGKMLRSANAGHGGSCSVM